MKLVRQEAATPLVDWMDGRQQAWLKRGLDHDTGISSRALLFRFAKDVGRTLLFPHSVGTRMRCRNEVISNEDFGKVDNFVDLIERT